MGEKSVHKRALIVEAARRVFVEKGFRAVTMKDIVDACGISRGGLYLYFNNTAEVFQAVLEAEQEREETAFEGSIPEEAAASDILMMFLREQKKEILRKKNSLTVACYEYFFAARPPKKENLQRRRFQEAAGLLEEIIEAGVQAGELYCEDPEGTARNMMFALEGMKVGAQSMGISEAMVDRQLMHMLETMVCEEA